MNRSQLRTVHRWVFTATGIFILIWLLSGLLMALPDYWFGNVVKWPDKPRVDYHKAVVSPAAAIARLEAGAAGAVEVTNLNLRQISGHLLYSITLADDGEQLVDAMTGEHFRFSPELAESMIRENFNIDAPLAEIEQLTEHSTLYPWGNLPVYRLVFGDSPSTSYFVVQNNLKLYRSSPVTKLRAAITSLHAFEPVNLLTSDKRIRNWLLIGISTIALAGAITGVLLTLPRRRG
jgi:hypothetical protein